MAPNNFKGKKLEIPGVHGTLSSPVEPGSAGRMLSIKFSKSAGAETVSNEEIHRQWMEDKRRKREQEEHKGGTKHFNIPDLVAEIQKEPTVPLTLEQKQEIRDLQEAKKQEPYMNPARRYLMEGTPSPGPSHSYHLRKHKLPVNTPSNPKDISSDVFTVAALSPLTLYPAERRAKQSAQAHASWRLEISECAACARLNAAAKKADFERAKRASKKNRHVAIQYPTRKYEVRCDKHRRRMGPSPDEKNIVTEVPLCAHVDLRLYWDVDDPGNRAGTWGMERTKVVKMQGGEHRGCKGRLKSVEVGVEELAVEVGKVVKGRGLRGVKNVVRVLRASDSFSECCKEDATRQGVRWDGVEENEDGGADAPTLGKSVEEAVGNPGKRNSRKTTAEESTAGKTIGKAPLAKETVASKRKKPSSDEFADKEQPAKKKPATKPPIKDSPTKKTVTGKRKKPAEDNESSGDEQPAKKKPATKLAVKDTRTKKTVTKSPMKDSPTKKTVTGKRKQPIEDDESSSDEQPVKKKAISKKPTADEPLPKKTATGKGKKPAEAKKSSSDK